MPSARGLVVLLSWLLLWLWIGIGCSEADAEEARCPNCHRLRDEIRAISLEAIKQQILDKLGMRQPPNITEREIPQIPPLEHLWGSVQADQPFQASRPEEEDDASATTEKVIVFAQPHPRVRHGRGQDVLYFRFSEKVQESRVVQAKLWLFLRGGRPEDGPLTITVSRVTRIPSSENAIVTRLVSSKETRPGGSGGRWVSLEMKKLVSDWFKNPRQNLGLVVDAILPGHDAHSHLIVNSPVHHDSSQIPFLEVSTEEGRKRTKRQSTNMTCAENSDETRCCRYPLVVDFEEFGWDWVIAPKKYEANYCSGECPFVYELTYPHTHISHLARPTDNSGPCCAPRKLSAISMLYFDKNAIIYSKLPDMVVDRCGCS